MRADIDRVVLASANAGKIREIAEIFSGLDITIVAQTDFDIESPEEIGATFVENALIKARFAVARSGLPAMADDSGIVVDALNGRPGVRSARFAGSNASDEQNLDKLLEEMAEIADDVRGGGFHCAAVLVFPEETTEPIIVEAVWRGTILRERKGDGGFGYDPVFLDPVTGKTGAEMRRAEKNAVSHRGKAFRELESRLREHIENG